MDPLTITVTLVALFLGGVVKGALGLGMPVVMVSVLAIVMPLQEALPIIAFSLLASNVWQIRATWRSRPHPRQVLGLVLPLTAATWIAAGFIRDGDPRLLNALVGLTVIAYVSVAALRWEPRIPARIEPYSTPLVGAAVGAVGGLTGMFGPQIGVYLMAIRMERDAMVGLLGWTLLAASGALALALAGQGLLSTAGDWSISVLAFLPALAGLRAGGRLRRTVPTAPFRRLTLGGLLVLGVANLRGLVA